MSVNKVILVGRLGADPESRSFPSGGSVCNLRVATTESWKDKQTGERQERTEWHRVSMMNRLGEIAQQYLRKGSQVYIEGSIRTRKWQDSEGKDQYSTEIVGREMTMLASRGNGETQDQGSQAQDASQPPQPASPTAGPEYGGGNDYLDDDIPFMPHMKFNEYLI